MRSMTTRPMNEADVPGADELRQLAGWNQTIADWRCLLSFEPEGCFVAVESDRIVGTVTTTTYGRVMAWIGMMLVHPDQRRRGIGMQLMQTALNYLDAKSIECIRLDATPEGQPLYEKLGFVREWTLTRHEASSPKASVSGTRAITESDWPVIERMDASAFGVPRTPPLRSFAQMSRAALVWPREGPIAGFGMLRPGAHSDYLGPVVCGSPEGATALIKSLVAFAESRPVFWDIPDANADARRIAEEVGFKPVRPLARMRLGPNTVRTNPAAQFGIADPSVG
jgi:predicted N-acetyltransferase YhbS